MASVHNPQPLPSSKWYYQLKSSIHYGELTLQRVLLYKLQEILPAYQVIYYDRKITSLKSPYDPSKPDFLLWKKDYTEWFVVEVELENHSLSHIRKQIENFYHGNYEDVEDISRYVLSKFPKLDVVSFANMIASNRPKIMLMADSIKCEWIDEFTKYDCLFSSLQVYTDEKENFLYRLNGDFPQEYSAFSYCTFNKRIRALDVSSKNFLTNLGYKNVQDVSLYYLGIAEYWTLSVEDGTELLVYTGEFLSMDLTHSRWKLIQNKNGQLHLLKS